MNKVKKLLLEQNKQASDEAIQATAKEYGVDLNNLSDDEARSIADKVATTLVKPEGLAVATNGASVPMQKQQRKGRKNGKQVSLKDAVVQAAKETETELTTVEDVLRQQKGKYIAQRSESIVNEIRNTSTEVVEAVTERLMEEKADAETFQQIGTELAEGLFPLVG